METIVLISLITCIIAAIYSVTLLIRIKDWRLGFLGVLLILMVLHQLPAVFPRADLWPLPSSRESREILGLIMGTMTFLTVYFTSRFILRQQKSKLALNKASAENRELERQLNQAQKMEAVGRLAGGVAHDFNNLLTAILNIGSLLLESIPEGDARREDVLEIKKAAHRGAELTKQLLTFSRNQPVKKVAVDLNETIRENEKIIARLLEKTIKTTLALAPETTIIEADKTQIIQVILNLAANARDAMPEGGHLNIKTSHARVQETLPHRYGAIPP